MTKPVKRVPERFHTATPYMIFKDAAPAIEWYKQAFGATELFRSTDDDGKIRHAEIMIGTSPIMMAGEFAEYPEWQSAETRGGSPVHLYLYVEDCDALFARALAASPSFQGSEQNSDTERATSAGARARSSKSTSL